MLPLKNIAGHIGDHVFRFAGEQFLAQALRAVKQFLRAAKFHLLGIFP